MKPWQVQKQVTSNIRVWQKKLKRRPLHDSSFQYVEVKINGFGCRHLLLTIDKVRTKQNLECLYYFHSFTTIFTLTYNCYLKLWLLLKCTSIYLLVLHLELTDNCFPCEFPLAAQCAAVSACKLVIISYPGLKFWCSI